MNSERNVRIVNRLLNTASIAMSVLTIFTRTQPEKGIFITIAVGLLLASMVQMILFRWGPGAFGDRPSDSE
jgi:hypothetical protein